MLTQKNKRVKHCIRCNVVLTNKNWSKQRQKNSMYICDNCKKRYDYKYVLQNKDKILKQRKIYNANNPHLIRKQALKYKFGISEQEYNTLGLQQHGLCAICLKEETVRQNGRVKALSVDHDHKTGEIRGLLCQKCNTGLGLFRHNLAIIKRIANYLNK